MANVQAQQRPRRWRLIIVGGIAGAVSGAMAGPFAMFAMVIANVLYDGVPGLGIEMLVSPVAGAIIGVPLGIVAGAMWPFTSFRRRQNSVAQLIGISLISGPIVALALYFPPAAVLVVVSVLLMVPLVTTALWLFFAVRTE
jgi:hypothetical protein